MPQAIKEVVCEMLKCKGSSTFSLDGHNIFWAADAARAGGARRGARRDSPASSEAAGVVVEPSRGSGGGGGACCLGSAARFGL